MDMSSPLGRRQLFGAVSVAFVIAGVLLPALALSDASEKPWCSINPVTAHSGRHIDVGEQDLAVATPNHQREAHRRLASEVLITIDQRSAERLTEGHIVKGKSHYYLVRTGVMWVGADYRVRSRLHATVYPEDGVVEIFDESLSGPKAMPTNVAVVVASDYALKGAESICLSAS